MRNLKSLFLVLFTAFNLTACSLISSWYDSWFGSERPENIKTIDKSDPTWQQNLAKIKQIQGYSARGTTRSEERRVGKECRSRWSPYH